MNQFKELPANKLSLAKRKPVFGVGITDAEYLVTYKINGKRKTCPYYATWIHMLERCYDINYQIKRPTYKGCSVCNEWLVFSNFKEWMTQQEWKDKCLDKDLLVRGNKEYSPQTCMFVTNAINTLLTDCGSARGEYAIGVYWHKSAGKYKAQCSVDGKRKHLGFFLTEQEASKVYKAFKRELIIVIANRQTDMRLKNALISIANTEYIV